MRTDQTFWECNGCRCSCTCDFGELPESWSSAEFLGGDGVLCDICKTDFTAWLRDKNSNERAISSSTKGE